MKKVRVKEKRKCKSLYGKDKINCSSVTCTFKKLINKRQIKKNYKHKSITVMYS